MNATQLACALCGETTFCRCLEAECRACNGEGEVQHPTWTHGSCSTVTESPPDPVMVPCDDCDGSGWIKCDRGGVNCRFSHCYCEAAWEAQEADRMSEPPISADERHRMAWREKQIAKGRTV
jgi:hypothetical protein